MRRLQRGYVLTACARLGTGYDAVAAAVRGELRLLLAAVPQLPERTLMDDTPTANPETREWLAAEGLDTAAEAPAEEDTSADMPAGDGTPAAQIRSLAVL